MLNLGRKFFVLLGMFVISSVAIYLYIGHHNSLILKAQDVAPSIINFDEINLSALNDLKQTLNSQKRFSSTEMDAMLNNLTRIKQLNYIHRKQKYHCSRFSLFWLS
jgi:uncharacterized protein YfkK (UPF0435 family)